MLRLRQCVLKTRRHFVKIFYIAILPLNKPPTRENLRPHLRNIFL